jgi:hypothetical protein
MVRYGWLATGDAEAFLPAGYWTQEGDGRALPETYEPDVLDEAAGAQLDLLERALAVGGVDERVRPVIDGICRRRVAERFRGDIAGDVWTLLESGLAPREWVAHPAARQALAWLVERFQQVGWSTKRTGSWEPVWCGDLLVATRDQPLHVRGRGLVWWIDDADAATHETARVRRLRFLRDTAGGCSPGFDEFRRLALTWRPTAAQRAAVTTELTYSSMPSHGYDRVTNGLARPGTNGARPHGGLAEAEVDHPNRVNSHVLHIEAAQSRTHYHPVVPVGDGRPQSEFYFGLDPGAYRLHAPAGATPRLFTFPRSGDWSRYDSWDVEPGVAVFIPPGTGHRGVDAFVNVVTIPGFKPGNEIYVDRLIAESGSGAPFNAAAARAQQVAQQVQAIGQEAGLV